MSKYKVFRLTLITLLLACIVGFGTGIKTNAMENVRCKIIIGDSRTMGLIATLMNDKDATQLYDSFDGAVYDAIFLKGDTLLVMCSQGGGYYKNGAYERAGNRAVKLLQTEDILKNCSSYSLYDLFGFNDIFLEPDACKEAPGRYIAGDATLASRIHACQSVYHFNAGPVDEAGSSTWKYCVTNPMLMEYNQKFVGSSRVSVVDLYGYLCTEGYKGIITEADDAGIHYDNKTNNKIINLLLALN